MAERVGAPAGQTKTRAEATVIGRFPCALTLLLLGLVTSACRDSDKGGETPSSSVNPAAILGAAGHGTPVPSATPSVANGPSAGPKNGAPVDQVIWEGTSGGLRIRWSDRDLSVRSEGEESGPSFSLVDYLRQEYTKNGAADQKLCRWEEKVRVLSIVGTIVSIERAMYSECARAAHPGGETRYASLDFQGLASAPQPNARRVELGDFFSAPNLVETMARDSVVRKALATPGHGTGIPGTPSELVKRLSSIHIGEPCVDFPLDLLGRFAFHHLDKQKVAVRVGLPGSGPCREELTQLGLTLPIPASLSAALTAASTRKEGFLMPDAEGIAKGHTLRFDFGSSAETIEKARRTLP